MLNDSVSVALLLPPDSVPSLSGRELAEEVLLGQKRIVDADAA